MSQTPEKTRKYLIRRIVFFTLLLSPLWSFLTWVITPKKTLNVLIFDKTVPIFPPQEHNSASWLLTHYKYTDRKGVIPNSSIHYFGVFPISDTTFKVRTFKNYSEARIDSLTDQYDFAFYADAYGVYTNDIFDIKKRNERSSLIYGRLEQEDIEVMKRFREKQKPLLGEFNILRSPTADSICVQGEDIFGLKTTGYTMRYYAELDEEINSDIPQWMMANYEKYHQKPWEFSGEGLVIVSENGVVEVLRNGHEMKHPVPIIESKNKTIQKYHVPRYVRYPYWIEVSSARDTKSVLSNFNLHLTQAGKAILKKHQIPESFPAVIQRDSLTTYFCGDFSDNPIPMWTAYFRGAVPMKKFLYNNLDASDRSKFFWEFYLPFVRTLLNDAYGNIRD
jgi:hypothetical protein